MTYIIIISSVLAWVTACTGTLLFFAGSSNRKLIREAQEILERGKKHECKR